MLRFLRPARVAGLLVLALAAALAVGVPAQAATENSGVPGKVRFVKRMDGSFNQYVEQGTRTAAEWTALKAWINQRFWRMEVFSPYFEFDNKVGWYTRGWVYKDTYSIGVGNADDIAARGQWILKDASGNRLYIPWSCDAGCPQYAADITSAAFRADWIANLKATLAKGYRGAWVDDVNLEMRTSDRNGNLVAPYSPSLGRVMTQADWRNAMATFMEEIRAAVPADKEILHNIPWFDGRDYANGATYYPEVDRQIKAADYINAERGFNDGGIRGGTGEWSLRTLQAYFDKVHALGKGVIIDGFDSSPAGREYALANYLLISNGADGIGEMSQTPDNWWTGWETNLGQPKSPRTFWNGLQRRDFDGGIALVNEPDAPTITATLPAAMKTTGGATVTSVTLAGGQGAVLSAIATAAAPTVTSISPSSGPAAGGTPVTITGTNLTGASVRVNGAAVTSTATATSVTFTTPAGTGTVPVSVTTAGGSASASFTYTSTTTDAPRLTALYTTTAYTDRTTPAEIVGANLLGATITVGGVAVVPQVSTPTRLVFTLPPSSTAGTKTIAVTNNGVTATRTFNQIARTASSPTITSLSPTHWYWDIATQVTITGTNFTGATLRVNGRAVTPSARSATSITALLPVGSTPGTVATISVSSTAGTATTMYDYDGHLGANLAPNGTFETTLTGWTLAAGATGMRIGLSTEAARSGTRSLKMTYSGAGGPLTSLSASAPAGRYQVSGWAKVTAGRTWSLDVTDSTGAVYATGAAVGTGDWQYIQVTGVTAATRAGVKFRVENATGAVAYLDDVAIQATT